MLQVDVVGVFAFGVVVVVDHLLTLCSVIADVVSARFCSICLFLATATVVIFAFLIMAVVRVREVPRLRPHRLCNYSWLSRCLLLVLHASLDTNDTPPGPRMVSQEVFTDQPVFELRVFCFVEVADCARVVLQMTANVLLAKVPAFENLAIIAEAAEGFGREIANFDVTSLLDGLFGLGFFEFGHTSVAVGAVDCGHVHATHVLGEEVFAIEVVGSGGVLF